MNRESGIKRAFGAVFEALGSSGGLKLAQPAVDEGIRAYASLDRTHADVVTTRRLDIATLVEDGHRVPAVFSDLGGLIRWAVTYGLDVLKIGDRGLKAVLIIGSYQPEDTSRPLLPYRQVWVAASCHRYREAMVADLEAEFSTEVDLRDLDADHAINRARLRHSPGAWCLLFPVHRRANRPFGSVERVLPPIRFEDGRGDLTPMPALKIMCTTKPTFEMIGAALRDVEGQIMSSGTDGGTFHELLFEAANLYIRLPKVRPRKSGRRRV